MLESAADIVPEVEEYTPFGEPTGEPYAPPFAPVGFHANLQQAREHAISQMRARARYQGLRYQRRPVWEDENPHARADMMQAKYGSVSRSWSGGRRSRSNRSRRRHSNRRRSGTFGSISSGLHHLKKKLKKLKQSGTGGTWHSGGGNAPGGLGGLLHNLQSKIGQDENRIGQDEQNVRRSKQDMRRDEDNVKQSMRSMKQATQSAARQAGPLAMKMVRNTARGAESNGPHPKALSHPYAPGYTPKRWGAMRGKRAGNAATGMMRNVKHDLAVDAAKDVNKIYRGGGMMRGGKGRMARWPMMKKKFAANAGRYVKPRYVKDNGYGDGDGDGDGGSSGDGDGGHFGHPANGRPAYGRPAYGRPMGGYGGGGYGGGRPMRRFNRL